MKHRLGNSTKCAESYFYIEKMSTDRTNYDGDCINPHNLMHGANGHKLSRPKLSMPVRWNDSCRYWEDADDRLTHYEVMTRQPEEWRSEGEKQYIRELLGRNKS